MDYNIKKGYYIPAKYYNEAYSAYIYFMIAGMPYSSLEKYRKIDTITLVLFTKLYYGTNRLDNEVIVNMALYNIVKCNKTGDASDLCEKIDLPDYFFERAKRDLELIRLLKRYLYSHVILTIYENNIVVHILEHKPGESIKFVLYGPSYKYKIIELSNLSDLNKFVSNIANVPKSDSSISRMIVDIIKKELI